MDKLINGFIFLFAIFSPFSIAGANISLLLALLSWLAKIVKSGRIEIQKNPLNVPLIALVAAAGLSVLASTDFLWSLKKYDSMWMAVIFFLAANNFKDKHSMKTAITALIIFTCITGMGGIFEHYFRVGFFQNENSKAYKYLAEPLHRSVGPFHHPVVFGMYLMMVIPLILPRLNAFNEIKSRWLSIIALLITTMGLIYTYSRGCWIAVLAALLFYGIMNIKPRKLLSWSIAGLIVLLLTVGLFPKWDFSVRVKSIFDLKYNNSNISRMSGWATSIKMMKDYPVFGVGWNRAGAENSRYIESNEKIFNHAHNMFINFAVETGIIGLGVLLWFYAVLFKAGLRIIRQTKDKNLKLVACSIMASVVAFIVSGMVDYPFNLPVIVSLFYFLIGILFAIPEMERSQHG